jgi:hypothetical protein
MKKWLLDISRKDVAVLRLYKGLGQRVVHFHSYVY